MNSRSSQDQQSSSSSPLPSSVWKILNGKNGDKYITFDDSNTSDSRDLIRGSEGINNASGQEIKVYKMRWFILTVICLANISNAINWISFSPIADYTGQFYKVDFTKVNYLSLIYLITSTPAGFFSFWIIDNFGVRLSLNFGSWSNLIGASIKLISALDLANGKPIVPEDSKYTVLMIGQFMCSLAQPFILFVATKFATNWFAEDQRALANTIALSSNTFGILIGAFISPLIVNSSVSFISEMCFLLLITLLISVIPAIMSCFITRSMPESPPSYSQLANNQRISNSVLNTEQLIGQGSSKFSENFKIYLKQVVKLLKSKDFVILFVCFGISLGVFNCFTTLIEQMVCTLGYTDNDSGYFSAGLIVSGLIGSLISGIIIDKTKRFEELSKICFAATAVNQVLLVLCLQWNNDNGTVYYLTLFTFCLFGFFGLPLLPICMDMSVECVYPIPEATSTGLLFIAGQIVGIFTIVLYPVAAREVERGSFIYESIQTCTASSNMTNTESSSNLKVLDYKNPLYFQTVLIAVMSIGFTLFFKCAYLRLRSEREKLAEQILRSATDEQD